MVMAVFRTPAGACLHRPYLVALLVPRAAAKEGNFKVARCVGVRRVQLPRLLQILFRCIVVLPVASGA